MCTRFQKEKGKKDDLSMFPLCHKNRFLSVSLIKITRVFSHRPRSLDVGKTN